MELIMTHDTKDKGFPLSGDHDFLPCCLAIFHVGELSDILNSTGFQGWLGCLPHSMVLSEA